MKLKLICLLRGHKFYRDIKEETKQGTHTKMFSVDYCERCGVLKSRMSK